LEPPYVIVRVKRRRPTKIEQVVAGQQIGCVALSGRCDYHAGSGFWPQSRFFNLPISRTAEVFIPSFSELTQTSEISLDTKGRAM
jgi:hypothetical protein